MSYRNSWGGFAPYVSIAERRIAAQKKIATLRKKGEDIKPVVIEGRLIAKTFWGQSWCKNLESYSDYENRLPRGRTYVRNGSVINLHLSNGEARAMVSGSSIYQVNITFEPITKSHWHNLIKKCSGQIDSLIELLQGKFSKGVMQIITEPSNGLFPKPHEIKLSCSCPDYATMCKHVAAVLYGIGARLDEQPEELFLLRQVAHKDLIVKAGSTELTSGTITLANDDLSSLFGIQIEDEAEAKPVKAKAPRKAIGKKTASQKTKKKTPAPKNRKAINTKSK